MPEFKVEFEVFCETCGAGLCRQSEGRNSYQRQMPQVTVEVCETCLKKATEPLEQQIEEYEGRIDELENEVQELKGRLAEIEESSDTLSGETGQ